MGDIIDKNGNKYKAAKFSLPDGANWEDYYVIIKREGATYTAVRYLNNDGGKPKVKFSFETTYSTKPQPPDRYLIPGDIKNIIDNKNKVKQSMDKIQPLRIPYVGEYTKEYCAAKTDHGFVNGTGNGVGSSYFIPFAARDFQ